LPVRASSANTLLQAEVTYIVPSTTSGVASWPRLVSRSKYHASFRSFTLLWSSLRERAEALLVVGAAVVSQSRVFRGGLDALVVDRRGDDAAPRAAHRRAVRG
jgi:hypothetical protein